MEPGDRHESLPERLIREAMEGGEFDDLAGSGEPLPGAGQPDDELWWARAWVRRSAPERRAPNDDADRGDRAG